jgi:hypothetical protein
LKRDGRPSESPLEHLHAAGQRDEHFGIWLRSDQAQRYVGCRSIKGWYEWRKRHGIVARSNGTVSRLDLDQALRRPRKSTVRAASLANLRRRVHTVESAAIVTSAVATEREA